MATSQESVSTQLSHIPATSRINSNTVGTWEHHRPKDINTEAISALTPESHGWLGH